MCDLASLAKHGGLGSREWQPFALACFSFTNFLGGFLNITQDGPEGKITKGKQQMTEMRVLEQTMVLETQMFGPQGLTVILFACVL